MENVSLKFKVVILVLAILVAANAICLLYVYSRLKIVNRNTRVLDHNLNVIKDYLEADSNTIKIQLPDGAKLVDPKECETNENCV